MPTVDDYLRRAVVALELALADPAPMDPMHRNAINLALSGVPRSSSILSVHFHMVGASSPALQITIGALDGVQPDHAKPCGKRQANFPRGGFHRRVFGFQDADCDGVARLGHRLTSSHQGTCRTVRQIPL